MAYVDTNPWVWWTHTSTESSTTISAGMGIDADGTLIASGEEHKLAGVSLHDIEAGKAGRIEFGQVNVLVTGTGTALDALCLSATAGKFKTAASTSDPVVGYALDTWTAAGTIRAVIFPSPRQNFRAVAGWVSNGIDVASIADTANSGWVGCGGTPKAVTITAVTAYCETTCTDAEDHIVVALYKSSAGTQTKIWEATTAADWTDAGLALVMETGGASLAAGDFLYLLITNETGTAIVPGIVWVHVAATVA